LPPAGAWGGEPPSRTSLARLAYPGLISTASRFNWQIKIIIGLLFVWLIFTCMLSWNVAAGRTILARLDAVEKTNITIQKKIADAEIEEVKRAPSAGGTPPVVVPPVPVAPPAAVAAVAPKPPIQRYCEQPRLLPIKNSPTGDKIDQFNDATQRQICDEFAENRANYGISREDIADWLAPWGWLKGMSHLFCGGRCLNDTTVALPASAINEHQWAAMLVEVLATAVLPLCYGFLGAGAAVVRNIWGKMRDSLLSPRDLTLSLGQLALGAVIGACIGLFVTPTGERTRRRCRTNNGRYAHALSVVLHCGVWRGRGVCRAGESYQARFQHSRSETVTRRDGDRPYDLFPNSSSSLT
jgi:hypothetical protein